MKKSQENTRLPQLAKPAYARPSVHEHGTLAKLTNNSHSGGDSENLEDENVVWGN